MNKETFIIGESEFTCMRMNVSAANSLFFKIQKIAVPVLSTLISGGKNIDLGSMDVKDAALALSEQLNDELLDTLVFPMLKNSQVYFVDKSCFIKSAQDLDKCFTIETLIDFYELVIVVGRYQFSPFFDRAKERFGSLIAAAPAKIESPVSSKKS